MTKITLNNVGSLIDTTTAQTTINNNNATIVTAFDNTLSRDGTSPNTMNAAIDMNSNQIVNLPSPATTTSPLRLQDLTTFTGGGTITNIPVGGTTGQSLQKTSNVNYAVGWGNSVSSIGVSAPADFTVTSSPVTSSGTIALTYVNTPTGTGGFVRAASPTIGSPTITGTVAGGATYTSPTLTTPVINGISTGTGVSALNTVNTLALRDANGSISMANSLLGYATTVTSAGTTTLVAGSASYQFFTGVTTHTVTLPVASTLVLGQSFTIENSSTGAILINSSGGSAVAGLSGTTNPALPTIAVVTCILTSGTTAASWALRTNYLSVSGNKRPIITSSLTFSGTDATVMTFPTTSATIARTDAANTFTGHQTIEGVTTTGATGTGNLVFDNSPTFSSNIAITGNVISSGSLSTFGPAGTGANNAKILLAGGSGSNAGASMQFSKNSVNLFQFGNASGILGGSSDDFVIYSNVSGAGSNPAITVASASNLVTFYSGLAVPAGGSTAARINMSATANLGVYFGSGAPTVSAAQGSLYIRTDGSSTSTRMYINTNGSTTWTNVTTAA